MSGPDGGLALYLVRHAFAAHADPTRWPDDAERPLTEDGAARFREAARGLRRIVPTVELMLSSGFARAWQTAELLHDVAGWPAPEACVELEVGRPPSAAFDVLRRHTVHSLALVGHEPHLSRLTSLLCTGSEEALEIAFKKGAVVSVSFERSVEPGRGSLRWIVPPKVLRKLDR
jgi:phosphohistidine phosphatase